MTTTFDKLKGAHVLVAEDNMMVALDLIAALEDAGVEVIGPAARVGEALAMIDGNGIDAAILDVNLLDGVVTPIAVRLIEGGIPVIFYTGTGLPAELAQRYGDLPVYSKPTPPQLLALRLSELVA